MCFTSEELKRNLLFFTSTPLHTPKLNLICSILDQLVRKLTKGYLKHKNKTKIKLTADYFSFPLAFLL